MKVFLSWSGSESKQLAAIFKEWLPNVLQYVDPYMSAQDISLGERWNNSIVDNLKESVYGLIFVTPSNINKPWINYEAGALSKTYDSRVVPILYNANVMILNEGPLKQFQSAKNLDKDSILDLLKSINLFKKDGQLEEARLEKSFDMWWPELEQSIDTIVNEDTSSETDTPNEPTERDLLNVILTKVIEQEKNNKSNQQKPYKNTRVNAALLDEIIKIHNNFLLIYDEVISGPYSNSVKEEVKSTLVRIQNALNLITNNDDIKREAIKLDKIITMGAG